MSLVDGLAYPPSSSPVGSQFDLSLVSGLADAPSSSAVGGPIDTSLVGGLAELCTSSPVGGPIDTSLVDGLADHLLLIASQWADRASLVVVLANLCFSSVGRSTHHSSVVLPTSAPRRQLVGRSTRP
ncbi:Hypothetical protein SMAX5B_005379 [Scophthalmus maximus]|uniref:Uncharacterized protein n=1 Tax=Scophthalmus maximus TaxID=52904 RepID=A0A2U9CBH5_SCOMX|nr:Hypothetical protein SMAX5B_005379 [Scophthalmus maximus]